MLDKGSREEGFLEHIFTRTHARVYRREHIVSPGLLSLWDLLTRLPDSFWFNIDTLEIRALMFISYIIDYKIPLFFFLTSLETNSLNFKGSLCLRFVNME